MKGLFNVPFNEEKVRILNLK